MNTKTHNRFQLQFSIAFVLFFAINSTLTAQNNALFFDGINEVAQIGGLSNFDGTSDLSFTIETWFNTNQTSVDATIWSIGMNSGSSLRLRLAGSTGFVIDDVDGDILTSATSIIAENRWHHSAVVYDGSEITLYIDGIEEGRVARAITLDGMGISVGQSTLPSGEFWSGFIDELRVWDYPISNEDLFTRLFTELNGAESGLLHYYDFNETAGTVLPDLTGVANGTTLNMDNTNWQTSEATDKQLNTALGNGLWSNPSSWSNGVPIPLDSVVIGANSNITVDQEAKMFDLVTSFSSTFTHDGFNIVVNGDMSATIGGSYFSESTDTVSFAGHNQNIAVIDNNIFGRLFLAGSGTKVMNQNSETNGFMFISSGVSLDLEFNSITLSGDASWINNGEMVFGGTLNFNGSAHGIFNPGEIENIFVNSAALFTLDSDLSIANTFEINNQGILEMQAFTITAPENWNLSGVDTIQWTSGAKIVIDKSVSSFNSGVNSEPINTTYPTLEVVEGGQFSAGFNLAIGDNESFIISGGESFADFPILILGENSDFTISSGFANFSSADIKMKNNSFIDVNGTGILYLQGGEGASQVAGNEPGDEYEIFLSGGQLFFEETFIQNLKGDGIVLSDGIVDRFNDVTFSDSPNATAYITIAGGTFDDLVISDIEFEAGPTFNVQKLASSGSGNIDLVNTRGNFTGPNFENVESGTLTWTNFDLYDDFTLDFNGTDDHIVIPGGPDFIAPLTVEAWVRPDNSTNKTILSWDLGGGQFASFDIVLGKLEVNLDDGINGGPFTGTTTIPSNTWTHVAFTYDVGVGVQFYVNGEPTSGGFPVGSVVGSPLNTYIGTRNNSTNFFDGAIDEVRIWNDLRTQAEINDNLYNELTGSEPNLIHYYNFNEGIGTVLNDIATAAPINGVVTAFGLPGTGGESDWNPVTDKPEAKQHALNFDGVDDFVTVANLPYTNDFTLEAWVRIENNTGTNTIASWDFDTTPNAFLAIEDGRLIFQTDDGSNFTTITASDSLRINEWHHVGLVKQGLNVELFLNGVPKETGVVDDLVGSSSFRIGNFESEGNQGFLNGSIDELRFWDRALDVQEIRDFGITDNITAHPSLGNLIYYADFNLGIVAGGDNTAFNTLPDLVSSGFSGILDVGFTLNTFEGNYVISDAFEALNANVVANDIAISREGNNVISPNDNTDFGIVLEGTETIKEFLVINEGFNPIVINEINNFVGEFSIEISSLVIQPFDTVTLSVTYSPTIVGLASEQFQFYYGDNSFSEGYFINVGGISYPDESGPGYAIDYTGSGSVNLDNGAHFTRSVIDSFTLEAWVKVSQTGSFEIFSNIESSTGGDGYSLSVINGQVRLLLQADQDINSSISASSDGLVFDNEWTHIAATYDGSSSENGIETYINGELQVSARINNAFSGEINNFNRFNPSLGDFGFTGRIDEFRLWDVVLTDNDIRKNLFNTVDPSDLSLSVYYRMDTGSGTEIIDLKGNSTGTLTGGPSPTFEFSHAPINNEDTFDGLFDKNALWSTNQAEVQSANLQMFNSGFLTDDGDNVIFAHDNLVAADDAIVSSNINNIAPLVAERLERNWYVEISDSTTNEGGEIDLLFENIPNDSTQTYFLLSSIDGGEYTIESYDGYKTQNDSVVFKVQADSILEKGFYTLARSLEFPGNALAFDGIDDSTRTSSNISHLEAFTYEAWINVDPASTDLGGILGLEASFNTFVSITIANDGTLEVSASDGSFTETVSSNTAIRDGNWHHFAVTRDFTNGLEIYIDGAFENTSTPQFSAISFNGPLRLGANRDGTVFSDFAIDELRIWNKRRTDQEILDNYEGVVTPGNTDLVYYNRFDQLGHNLPDLSGNTTASSLYNFQFDNTESGWITSDAFSSVAPQNALSFDGLDDVVQVPTLNAPTGSFTLETWVNYQGAGTGFETILEFGDDSPYFGLSEGIITLFGAVVAPTPLELNAWKHLAVTYDDVSKDIKLYEDGFVVSESNQDLNFTGTGLGIGQNVGDPVFNGAIDDVRIWDRALSESDIRVNIVKEVDPLSANLLAFYDFNIGIPDGNNAGITVLPDLTGNHDGTISNFDLTGTSSNFITSEIDILIPKISLEIDGVTYFNNEDLDYGIVFENDSVFTEVIVRNIGFDTLNISGPVSYGLSVDLEIDLNEIVLDPFESDVIRFFYFPNTTATVSAEALITISSDDPINPIFNLTASAQGYPELPGAGSALLLDGISDVATTPNSTDVLTNKSFTVEFWAKRPDNSTPDYVFGSGPVSGPDNEQLHIGFKTGDVVTLSFKGDDLDYTWPEADTAWNHFAMSYNTADRKQKIHINGIAVDSATAIADYSGIGQFYIGSASFGENFEGSIDELRVWNFALPDSVIRHHMAHKLGGSEDYFLDSLIAYYRFEEGTGTEIYDLAENEVFGFQNLNLTGGVFEPSGAYLGDGSLFTYTDTQIDADQAGSNIKVSNIDNPAKGVHLFIIQDDNASSLSTDIYQSVRTDEEFGVFAPGNTFDYRIGTAAIGTTDSLRIVKRLDNALSANYSNASNLFGVDVAEDSVRAFNQTSGVYSVARINYPARTDAGTALTFDGTDDAIDIQSIPIQTYSNFTVEFWIQQPAASSGQQNFFTQSAAGGSPRIILCSTLNGRLYFFLRETDGGANGFLEGNQQINDDEWHHVAYVRNAATLTTYIDGILDASLDLGFSGDIVFPSDATTTLSGDATIDEFRLWNTNLSINNIRSHIYTNDISTHPDLSELKAYYRFDEESPSTNLIDLAAANNGTLTNMNPLTDWVTSEAFSVPANTVVSLADDGPGSFRDVIRIANQTPEMDTVKFDLPGVGPWIISTNTQIDVTDSLYIDATTQPGWNIVTGEVVELEGVTNSVSIGLFVSSDYVELYGMRFNGFANVGVELNNNLMSGYKIGSPGKGNIFINNMGVGLNISGADNGSIKSNFIGADYNGTDHGNDIGLFINNDANNNIVGEVVAEANVIAFNNVGVQANDATSTGNQIRQNEISCNISNGITLGVGGNNNIAAPIIDNVSLTEVSGTGIDGQLIDVYNANDACDSNQGNGYLGTATVSGTSWTLTGLTLVEGEHVSATATVIADGTSEFSNRFQVGEPPLEPIVDVLITASLEPVVTGTYDESAELSVEIDGALYTLGVDAQLTNSGVGIWSLDLTGSPLSGIGIYDVVVTSTKPITGLTSVDLSVDEINIVDNPVATTPALIESFSSSADWDALTGVSDYALDVSADNGFTQYVAGFQNLVVNTNTTTITGLEYGTSYFYRVRGIIAPGDTTDYSNIISFKTTIPAGTTADSTALVNIYNDLNGTGWSLNTNWLQANQRIETWSGVTVVNGRVTGIDLQSNNLNGALPIIATGELENLTTFLLNDNQIEGLSDLSLLSSISDLQVQNNNLTFEDLTVNAGITGIVYNPQAIILVEQNQLFNQGEDIILDRGTGNAGDLYAWFKDGTEITGEINPTLTISGLDLNDNGAYNAIVTNPGVPGLTLRTNPINVTVSSLERDSTALVTLYTEMNGASWVGLNDWTSLPIASWQGITITNNSVTELNLSGVGLTGALSTEILNVVNLISVNLSGNGLEDIPDLTSLGELTSLDLSNNNLTFTDLLVNAGITGIVYSPQAILLDEQTEFINEGNNLILDRGTGNPGDVYTWYKNNIVVPGETSATLTLPALTFSDEGSYRAEVTNPGVPGLTLGTNAIVVRVSSLERDSIALRALYVEMNGSSWTGRNDWLSLPVENWLGITIAGNRVTELDLSNANVTGTFSSEILDVLNITSINLSGNTIENIPDLTPLTNLTNLDLSNNRLQFDDLIPNKDIVEINFEGQSLGDIAQPAIYIPSGSEFELSVNVGGANNVYQWSLEGSDISGANSPVYQIEDIGRSNMGGYECVITNPDLPTLTFTTQNREVFAKAKISGTVKLSDTEVLTAGTVLLFQVNDGAYDTLDRFALGVTGTYMFDTILADYLVLVDPSDGEAYIPTYHESTIQWDEAAVIPLNNDTIGIDLDVAIRPVDPTGGDGTFLGDIFTDFPEEGEGRIEARRRVRRVGVALRRRRSSGRTEMDEFDLVGYTQTDEDGKFSFGSLPSGLYRFFVEYPGIPIKEDAFVEFEITDDGKNNDVTITATVFEDGIEINGNITGILKDYLDELLVYPNPVTNGNLFVRIQARKGFEINLELIDLRGKTVLSENINNQNISNGIKQIDIQSLNAGFYIIRISVPELDYQIYQTGKLIVKGKN